VPQFVLSVGAGGSADAHASADRPHEHGDRAVSQTQRRHLRSRRDRRAPRRASYEYVGGLAYAIKMAEATDGLVLPGMAYFFPDATIVGRGEVHVTPSEGIPYLMAVARSLFATLGLTRRPSISSSVCCVSAM